MNEEFFVGVNELDVNRLKAEIKKGPDDRSRDVATEVARGEISKLVQQGKEIGGWLMAGETIQTGTYLLGEKELLSEDVVEMLVEKKSFMERLEIIEREVSSRSKKIQEVLDTSGDAEELKSRVAEKIRLQSEVVVLKSSLLEAGLKFVDKGDFVNGFRAFGMSGVGLDADLAASAGEAVWVTYPVAEKIKKLRDGGSLPEEVVKSLAEVNNMFTTMAIMDVNGGYRGDSDHVRVVAEAKAEAMRRVDSLEAQSEKSEVMERFGKERAEAWKKLLDSSVTEEIDRLRNLDRPVDLSSDNSSAWVYLSRSEPGVIDSFDGYLEAMEKIDEKMVEEMISGLAKEELFFQNDLAGYNKSFYRDNIGNWEESWNNQNRENVNRARQGCLLAAFAIGNREQRSRVLRTLGDNIDKDLILKNKIEEIVKTHNITDFETLKLLV